MSNAADNKARKDLRLGKQGVSDLGENSFHGAVG